MGGRWGRVLCWLGFHRFYDEQIGPGCIFVVPREDCARCHKAQD